LLSIICSEEPASTHQVRVGAEGMPFRIMLQPS
jgi:hypothetical protein